VSNFTADERTIRVDNAAAESMRSPRSEDLSRRDKHGFDKPAVAGLAIGIISKMSADELISVIDGADLPLINNRNRQRLKYLDRPSLERLAQLARRCCRNQGY
jgi:hypothetical protein